MTIQITIYPQKVEDRKAFAERLRGQVLTEHAARPFADLDAVSSFLHADRNPRLSVTTNEKGTRTEVSYNNERLLSIHG